MKLAKTIVVFFLSVITFCGCRKEAIEAHPEMEGKWMTYVVTATPDYFTYWEPRGKILYVQEDKNSSYENYDSETKVEGKAKFHSNILKIKDQTLHITTFPSYNSKGDYRMVIDGEEFISAMAPRLRFTEITSSSARIIMDLGERNTESYFNENDESFDVQYRLQNSTTWNSLNLVWPGNFTLSGLLPASTYECRAKTNYPWRDSEYCPITTFTTH